MAEVKWTKEQQKVIDTANRNLLVSAAAGSGKTAVLVERILTMITKKENPLDINEVLVVTFTKAAAAEMKERLSNALEKKVSEMPEDPHLQKQSSYIHQADITTIDSFCVSVIKNHFHEINLDPSFRTAEEAELKLLMTDVLQEILEEYYEKAEESFLTFTECYAYGKTDEKIEELVLQLYQFAMSYPWPKKWMKEKEALFFVDSIEELESSGWMKELMEYLSLLSEDFIKLNESAIQICESSDGPYPYLQALESDRDLLKGFAKAKTYKEYQSALQSLSFTRLSSKKDESVSEDKKEQVKKLREQIKKGLTDIKAKFFFQSEEEMLHDIKGCRENVSVLISLAVDFMEAFSKAKAERNIIDFNDMEHFALKILVDEESMQPTLTALEYQNQYREILIDEYQDSNLVQETILNSISRESQNMPNVFMVGDVKQSIYKFRLARPELFLDKYSSYSTEDSKYQKIELHKNFRSRREVLIPINYLFERIMTGGLGGIEYTEDVFLNPGMKFPETSCDYSTELLFIAEEKDVVNYGNEKEEKSIEEQTDRELEARGIAKRILELTNPQNGTSVMGKDNTKKAEFGDIVILLRTMSGWAETFMEVLLSFGIPAYSDTQSGYFSALEVKTVLNLLRIIDNPRQDIPLAAVLHSPIGGFDGEDLSRIRAASRNTDLYDALLTAKESADQETLKEKIICFLEQLAAFRSMVPYTSIHELIEQILKQTGYGRFVKAMPAGEKRNGNLSMLVQKAVDFEKTSYTGLFQFIRYIEKLHKYEVDYGESMESAGNENSVRIMSIHKSKGLEFPIVFAAGLGKTFNMSDARNRVILHPDLGVGPDFVDAKLRYKIPTLMKKVMQKKMTLENLGEELRVLYVALTRAKEKLILTGMVKNFSKKLEHWMSLRGDIGKPLKFITLASAACYFDWIVPAFFQNRTAENFLQENNLYSDIWESSDSGSLPLVFHVETARQIVGKEVLYQIEKEGIKRELLNWDINEQGDKKIGESILKRLQYVYPYLNQEEIPVKVSVSELKNRSYQKNEEEESLPLIRQEEKEPTIPGFVAKKEPVSASMRGTIYHTVLENLNFDFVKTGNDFRQELNRMEIENIITSKDRQVIYEKQFVVFLDSPLANRIRIASREGRLKREKQFMIGVPASEINDGFQCEELVIVQGVIDTYFEEEDGLVLLDYKTDYVPEGETERFFVQKYKKQLDYYERALQSISGRPVKEKLIYSFHLGKEIRM